MSSFLVATVSFTREVLGASSVCRYNLSKQDKHRIDFFVPVNATNGKSIIYHINVYRGKNATNEHVVEEAWNLPTMQQTIVNVQLLSGIDNNQEGMLHRQP